MQLDKLVYLMIVDNPNENFQLSRIAVELESLGYQIRRFLSTNELKAACAIEMPMAFVVGAIACDHIVDNVQFFSDFAKKEDGFPGVVFVCDGDTADICLSVIRSSTNHYFCSLKEIQKLPSVLDGFLCKREHGPIGKVLLVGDDLAQLTVYEKALSISDLML